MLMGFSALAVLSFCWRRERVACSRLCSGAFSGSEGAGPAGTEGHMRNEVVNNELLDRFVGAQLNFWMSDVSKLTLASLGRLLAYGALGYEGCKEATSAGG